MLTKTRALAVPAGGMPVSGRRRGSRLRGLVSWLRFILRLVVGLVLLPLLVVGLLLGRARWRWLFRRELRRCGVPARAARELAASADLAGGLWRGWRGRNETDD
ncbi:MAG: hypothetical protein QM270_00220 [Bacillota bacterium]|nr:hypothetical protein [Bacillota bacterium]